MPLSGGPPLCPTESIKIRLLKKGWVREGNMRHDLTPFRPLPPNRLNWLLGGRLKGTESNRTIFCCLAIMMIPSAISII